MLADRKYKRELREVEVAHRATQEGQKTEKDNLYKDRYNEKFTNDRGEKCLW